MAAELLRYPAAVPGSDHDATATVAAVTDAPELLDVWPAPGTAAAPTPAGPTPHPAPLAREPRLLLRTIDDLAVEAVAQLDWRRVDRAHVALLRGLARHPRTAELLRALAATGLEPRQAARLHLGDHDGIEVELVRGRDGADGLTTLTRAHRLATLGRELLPAPDETPRVALADIDAPWVHTLGNVHHVDARWEHDPALLREASPTLVLAGRDALAGPLAGAIQAARDFGAKVATDRDIAEVAPAGATVPDRDQVHQVWAALGDRLGVALVRAPRLLVVAIVTTAAGRLRALADHRHQRHPERDLLVVGGPRDPQPQDTAGRPKDAAGLPADAARLPTDAAWLPEDASVADVLDHARGRGATWVTLFEEHARYGAEHLGDLVRAHRRTRADLLLRPAELHLEATTGRLQHAVVDGVEAATRSPDALALATHAEDLAHLDQRAEMRSLPTPALAAALLHLGARAHRTHGRSLASLAPAPAGAVPAEPARLTDLALAEVD